MYICLYIVKRRSIATVLDVHQQDLDVKTLTTGLESMGILTREQSQKLTAMVDGKKRHEALLYVLIAQGKPDCYDKLLQSEYMMSGSLSLAAVLQGYLYRARVCSLTSTAFICITEYCAFRLFNAATFKTLKGSPSSVAVIGSSQCTYA